MDIISSKVTSTALSAILTMSLGFHVPPDAFAAEGDITAVKT